jgi:hypothetical protein
VSSLPKYAERANPGRLVKIFCKDVRRPHTAWAEMNTDYPGQDVLQRSQVGDFTATCLRCGKIARDPYNWSR